MGKRKTFHGVRSILASFVNPSNFCTNHSSITNYLEKFYSRTMETPTVYSKSKNISSKEPSNNAIVHLKFADFKPIVFDYRMVKFVYCWVVITLTPIVWENGICSNSSILDVWIIYENINFWCGILTSFEKKF